MSEDANSTPLKTNTEYIILEVLMARYASGRKAWGYSDRSGFRYRLRDMRKEWNGLKLAQMSMKLNIHS